MRVVALILLWMGVVGFGLFTLCSGAFALTGEAMFWLMTVAGAALTWGCFAWARSLSAKSLAEDDARRRDPQHGAQP
jgi:hypothetical protein